MRSRIQRRSSGRVQAGASATAAVCLAASAATQAAPTPPQTTAALGIAGQQHLALQGSNTFKVCVQQVCYVRAVSAVCLCRSAVHKALYQGSFAVAAQLLAAGGSLEAADNQVGKRCIMVFWKGGVCVLSSL
jgi:hypothetical protein